MIIHKPEYILKKETYKILKDFKIQIDHKILARQTDLVIVNKKKREPAKVWTLPSQWTTEWKSKKTKRETTTQTLPENKKSCGTWKWRWYLLQLVPSEQSLKACSVGWKSWKLEKEQRPSKLHYWVQSEYWEASRRLEEICYHSDSSERPSVNAGMKNSQGTVIMIIIILENNNWSKYLIF